MSSDSIFPNAQNKVFRVNLDGPHLQPAFSKENAFPTWKFYHPLSSKLYSDSLATDSILALWN